MSKSSKGLILSFIATLPMQDAHSCLKTFYKTGDLPLWVSPQFSKFLENIQEKTPQGGPAGQST